jgi:O-antigen/teichoic acid export membrane protein
LGRKQIKPVASDLKNKFLYQLALSVTQLLFPLLSYPYVSRILGPEGMGQVNYVDFTAQLFILLAAFGIPYHGIREIAKARDDAEKRSRIIKELVSIHLLLTLISVVGFILFTFRHWNEGSTLYLLAIISILSNALTCEWYFQGMEDFRFISIRSIIIRLIALAAVFILVQSHGDTAFYYGILIGSTVLITLLNVYKLLKDNRFAKGRLQLLPHLKPLWYLFLTSSIVSLYIYFDTVLLGRLASQVSVGYYSTSLKIVRLCLVVAVSLTTIIMPRFSYLAASGQQEEMKRYLHKLFNFIVTISVPMGAGLMLLAPEIIRVFAGNKFDASVVVLQLLAFIPLLIGLSNIFGVQVLLSMGQERKLLYSVIIGSVVSITLNLVLIPIMSERGAAIANLSAETMVLIATAFFARKIIPLQPDWKLVTGSVVLSLLFIPLVWLTRYFIADPLIILVTVIPICTGVYLILQKILFRNQLVTDIIHFFTQLIARYGRI